MKITQTTEPNAIRNAMAKYNTEQYCNIKVLRNSVNDDEDRWILGDSEQVNFESTSSAPTIKATIAARHPPQLSVIVTTTGSINPTTTNTSSTRTVAPNASANENHFPNKTKTISSKNNQNTFYVKNDIVLAIDSNKSLKDADESAKAVANAEYYQYFTDDSYRTKVDVPHFSEKSWMAFPVLRGAYKYVQVGVFFLLFIQFKWEFPLMKITI